MRIGPMPESSSIAARCSSSAAGSATTMVVSIAPRRTRRGVSGAETDCARGGIASPWTATPSAAPACPAKTTSASPNIGGVPGTLQGLLHGDSHVLARKTDTSIRVIRPPADLESRLCASPRPYLARQARRGLGIRRYGWADRCCGVRNPPRGRAAGQCEKRPLRVSPRRGSSPDVSTGARAASTREIRSSATSTGAATTSGTRRASAGATARAGSASVPSSVLPMPMATAVATAHATIAHLALTRPPGGARRLTAGKAANLRSPASSCSRGQYVDTIHEAEPVVGLRFVDVDAHAPVEGERHLCLIEHPRGGRLAGVVAGATERYPVIVAVGQSFVDERGVQVYRASAPTGRR